MIIALLCKLFGRLRAFANAKTLLKGPLSFTMVAVGRTTKFAVFKLACVEMDIPKLATITLR